MNKFVGIALLAVVLVGGAWFLLSQGEKGHHDEHGHEEGHDDHDDHDDHGHDDDHELPPLEAKEPVRADGTFSIATSFYPLEFALTRIVGDLAEVTNVGEGRDPHDFRPSTQDILTLQQSDLVVLQGAEFEPWANDVNAQLITEEVPVVLATAEIKLREAGEDEHGDEHEEEEHEDEHDGHNHGAHDPHTWLDPVLMSEMVEHLAEAVSTLDPENAGAYEVNAATLQAQLAQLHTEYEEGLASCTVDEVIASHDAFGYLAARYGITIHSIGGLSTQDLPSAQTLAELKEEAEEGVNAILLEENNIASYGETLAAETGLQTLPINPIAYVVPEGEDYLSLMRANLETLETALVCNG